MGQASATNSVDSDRAELEIVLAALARNPRLAKLLQFIADRYFGGKADEITEYNIATEVFGRSKTSFDASRDSIARVEAYRLRKKLKEYYGAEGSEHETQISLPPGSYVPVFTHRTAPSQSIFAPGHHSASTEPAVPPSAGPVTESASHATEIIADEPVLPRPRRFGTRTLMYSMAGIAAILLAGFAIIQFHGRVKAANQPRTERAPAAGVNQPPAQNTAPLPLRLLAGYSGSPRIDSAGAYWQSDRYFEGGAAFRRPDLQVARTSDPMLFEYWRTGDFSYNIPLPPGPYELHLYFVASPPEDFKTQFFHVTANGQPLLKSFNIGADALGVNIANEKVFRDIHPDNDGYLHLKFFTERSSPTLNAIEILPGLPHRQLPVRLVMQPAAVVDHGGNLWHPDDYYQSGTYSDFPRQVSGTPDPSLYARERYGHFTYSIPVDTRGRYTLVLHFAELYWIPDAAGTVGVGSRLFHVYCNGLTLLDNFDIFKEAGSLHALTKTFYHLRPSPEGKLDLTFDPIVNYATVSGIEVIDESE